MTRGCFAAMVADKWMVEVASKSDSEVDLEFVDGLEPLGVEGDGRGVRAAATCGAGY